MNVERVTPKNLEREKAAEYALAVCKEGLGKSGVKTKNLGGGSFGTAVGVTLCDGGEAVVKFLRVTGCSAKRRTICGFCPKIAACVCLKFSVPAAPTATYRSTAILWIKSRAKRSLCHSASSCMQRAHGLTLPTE